MNGKMAGGHLVIKIMKILIVIFINIETLELRALQPGGAAVGNWRAPLKGTAVGQMAGGRLINISMTNMNVIVAIVVARRGVHLARCCRICAAFYLENCRAGGGARAAPKRG